MSWLSKAAKGVSHVVSTNVRGLGRTQEKINHVLAPVVGAIPGVGPALVAAANASASVMAGHNLKHTAGEALKGAVAGGLGKLGGAVLGGIKSIPGAASLPGMQSIGGAVDKVKGVLGSIPGADKVGGIVGGIKGAARAANGGKPITLKTVGGMLGKAGGAVLNNPELAAAGLSGFAGYRDARRADQLENDSIDTLRNAYLALNPNAPREDTSALFADPGNPYTQAKKIRLGVG